MLEVLRFGTKAEAGEAGAVAATEAIATLIARDGNAAVIFASAVSQDSFLGAIREKNVDWERVTAVHMDEYAGMAGDHPASFRRFLRDRLFDHVPVASFHQLRGEAADLETECARYAALLQGAQPGLLIMGVGENGHLAFIDPGECRFDDTLDVRVVELDEVCRMQQVHDGAFSSLDEVPKRALSLTIPLFLRIPRALIFVNGPAKSPAIRDMVEGPISESCPASAMRQHADARLYLDSGAAELLRATA